MLKLVSHISNSKSFVFRFKEKLFAAKNFFDDLPNQVCDLHQDFSFGIATFGKCWDGKTIVNK